VAATPVPPEPEVLDVKSGQISRLSIISFGVLIALGAAGCGSSRSGSPTATSLGVGMARVSRVVDGDTIVVDLSGRSEKIRLLGIDTPETKSPSKPVQCYGHEASAHTADLLTPGTEVRLERDVEERDQYGRLLAYVYRSSDDLFVNLELARDGFASLLTYEPNVAHVGELSSAVDDARSRQAGLWGQCGGPGVPVDSSGGAGGSVGG
jgi:micrococcal nuclease